MSTIRLPTVTQTRTHPEETPDSREGRRHAMPVRSETVPKALISSDKTSPKHERKTSDNVTFSTFNKNGLMSEFNGFESNESAFKGVFDSMSMSEHIAKERIPCGTSSINCRMSIGQGTCWT